MAIPPSLKFQGGNAPAAKTFLHQQERAATKARSASFLVNKSAWNTQREPVFIEIETARKRAISSSS
jgi:hypothetical protein